jgi:hypothetical protein
MLLSSWAIWSFPTRGAKHAGVNVVSFLEMRTQIHLDLEIFPDFACFNASGF